MTKSTISETTDLPIGPMQKLVVSGAIGLEQGCGMVVLRRGMQALTEDGQAVYMVAAVVVDSQSQEVTQILLGRVPPTSDYRLIPIDRVAQVRGGAVWLHTSAWEIEKLARYQPVE